MAPPALPPLSSLPADYVSAYTGGRLLGTVIVFFILEIVFVGLRFWSKSVGRVARGADDYLIVAALTFCLGVNVCALAALKLGGIGHHYIVVLETAPQEFVAWGKIMVSIQSIYGGALAFPKLAILVFYNRVFTLGWTRIATHIVMVFVIISCLMITIGSLLQCIPLSYFWDKSIEGGHCFDIVAFDRFSLLPQIISDVLILLLPIPTIWRLQSPTRTKIGIWTTFLTGSIGMIAWTIRTVNFFGRNEFVDFSWTGVNMWIWIVVEPGSYLIAACLVCMRPLAKRCVGRSTDGKTRRSNPFFTFSSIRTRLLSSRNESLTSSRTPPVPLNDTPTHSFRKPHIKVDSEVQLEDEEKLVGRRSHSCSA